jgi:endogenous inhibitor of DNA gyrase (YacG/DUF329 family)
MNRMLTIECPLCAGPASADDALDHLDCPACGVLVEIAADPRTTELAAAA